MEEEEKEMIKVEIEEEEEEVQGKPSSFFYSLVRNILES